MRAHPEPVRDLAFGAAGAALPDPSAVFGAGVTTAAVPVAVDPPALHVAEWAHVAAACPGRKREYATSRALARALLARLGYPDRPIPAGVGGAPVWPDGTVGSISHAADVCVVAVSRAGPTVGLGIDLEPARPMEPQIVRHVLTRRERAWLARDPDPLVAARIVFSAKESVYKSLHPLCGVFLDFQDLEIRLDRTRGSFAVAIAQGAGTRRDLGRMRCRFAATGTWIVTGVTLVGTVD